MPETEYKGNRHFPSILGDITQNMLHKVPHEPGCICPQPESALSHSGDYKM